MNFGPLIFLAAFFALSGSWFAFVLSPHQQIGRLQPTNSVPAQESYALPRPGIAAQGLDVYRANGCAYCHSQQVRQTATVCDVLLTAPGTNQPALVATLLKLRPDLDENGVKRLIATTPAPVLRGVTPEEADGALKKLKDSRAKAERWVSPAGPDIARGWGRRRSVAYDFLFDSPVMLGSQRVGPDLANVGLRRPDANWHLRHLYAPRMEEKRSAMPPYRFLFEKRKIGLAPSPDAMVLPGEIAPEPGFEIVPRPEARALAAYLVSLRAEAPLYVAPLSIALGPPPPTNAPAPAGAATTNSASTNAARTAPASAAPTNSPAK